MKRKVSKLRPSPNEEARIIREEQERRRKLRIQQVREQQKHIALQIRREVEQRRQHELQQLEQELREEWTRQQRDKLQTLQRLYQESLQLIGQGHRSAKENEPDLVAIAQREEENQAKAEERYREALKELKTQQIRDHDRQNRPINARKKALQAEKERSAKVASLPPPLKPIQSVDVKKPHVVRRCDPSAFATTHYHMLESAVEREAETVQPDAHTEAELEARRLQELQKEEKRRREEQLEKARVRGRQALRREQLVQDRERLLVELEHLQQTDMLRRRQQVAQMPPQIFQPLYKRQETREDFQRDMEFAFEDMYTGERRVKGDLVVQLVPEPLPASSTGSRDQELDVTLDETSRPEAEHVHNDTERQAGSSEQETSAEAEPPKPAPRRALRKLLDRIRSQRDEWVSGSSRVSDSPTVFTDLIPERDTSIESGSLQSEEKHEQTPIEAPEGTTPPPAEELKDQPHRSLPHVLASKFQEFDVERKKREEELETEKRQHMFLLQELEEQKAKLEQMLLEAQQERDRLTAAATQETILNQEEEPAWDQQVTPGLITQPAPPAGEDDHTSRVREYQQRLLEQNRVHQRSVEVARHRLEEYQRALQIRHNMTFRSLLPVVRPPSIFPLLGAQSDRLPAPLQLPTPPAAPPFVQNEPQISAEVVTRDSEALAPPPCPAPSAGVCSELKSGESVSDTLSLHRPDGNTYLTDDIMKKVTEHLPDRLRPSSELLPHKLLPSISQSSSDPLRAVSPRSPSVGAGLIPREDTETQREAVMQRLQEEGRRRREVELEQMRRQKSTLQALIDTDGHVSQTPCEELHSEDAGQRRRMLLVSLLKAIEESNGGTLSHLEDAEERDGSLRQTLCDSAETGGRMHLFQKERKNINHNNLNNRQNL
ncbi:centrosomal protein of 295 kDa [Nematolebias whitei]|uniref:centrosomal protein of 295 kDa n=1 Tax=Nematolebias whitei TaxID=451745 RepID=UPI00189C3850|nr:centrosomal protein of 295 kDa [Nematolebias whitei]